MSILSLFDIKTVYNFRSKTALWSWGQNTQKHYLMKVVNVLGGEKLSVGASCHCLYGVELSWGRVVPLTLDQEVIFDTWVLESPCWNVVCTYSIYNTQVKNKWKWILYHIWIITYYRFEHHSHLFLRRSFHHNPGIIIVTIYYEVNVIQEQVSVNGFMRGSRKDSWVG